MKATEYESIATKDSLSLIGIKPSSKWTCYMFGGDVGHVGIVWIPEEGKEPCWFWRKMQYLCFGNSWVKTL